MHRRTGIIFIGLTIAVLAALIYGFWPKPFAVEVARVEQEPLEVTVLEEGKTRLRDRYVISASVTGYASRLLWKVGDAVRQGQRLADVEPLRANALDPRVRAEAEARLAAAQAALKVAEENARAADASATYAKTDSERLQRLYALRYISRGQLDLVESEVRRTTANLRSAQSSVTVARFRLEEARQTLKGGGSKMGKNDVVSVASPITGHILKLLHESEGVVTAGQALLEIGEPEALEVVVEVLSADAVQIRPGMRVWIERWGGEQRLEGRVRVVEPVGFTKISALGVEEQRVLVIVDIITPAEQWRRLGDGYRIEARFVLWEGDKVLQIPSSALFREQNEWAVFVVEAGKARRRRITIGHRGGLRIEVTSGLRLGETVITHPGDEIKEGNKVITMADFR